MLRILTLFVSMSVAYVVLGVNIRALSHGKIGLTGITEFTYALISFAIIRFVADAHSWWEAVGYAAGATVGCLLSIGLTKHWGKP